MATRSHVQNTAAIVQALRLFYSQVQLAQMIGSTVNTIGRWEDEGSTADAKFAPALERAVDRAAKRLERVHLPASAAELRKAMKPSVAVTDHARENGALTYAMEFLSGYLVRERPRQSVERQARKREIKPSTLRRAAIKLRVRSRLEGFGPKRRAFWGLE